MALTAKQRSRGGEGFGPPWEPAVLKAFYALELLIDFTAREWAMGVPEGERAQALALLKELHQLIILATPFNRHFLPAATACEEA
eukprot:CAMPEP_0185572730 /NCGR_PEP_ID=MMETSP0434-20130131/4603_1 /TAXON_ID=626734 ORGANISM="Favella taraikaensis, Strain Fe Narragansett Bay" /NCGR_SAMPLE_ID=MMETSP0434 /ASSEMBLY_ACC=CAM_ASM_000379 /LENGTH=84 /DNA_ID=CAMNT_0028188705 /DNA_START=993 /DNA_END=1248 /DNA_ORIENTATION=-